MKFFGFRGGVHPPENKLQTETFPVEKLEAPKTLYVPLLQHIGAPLDPIVAVGDQVLKGQKIADSQGFLTSPIHSPVSGMVKKIEERRSEEHTSELQSRQYLVCRLLLEKK